MLNQEHQKHGRHFRHHLIYDEAYRLLSMPYAWDLVSWAVCMYLCYCSVCQHLPSVLVTVGWSSGRVSDV